MECIFIQFVIGIKMNNYYSNWRLSSLKVYITHVPYGDIVYFFNIGSDKVVSFQWGTEKWRERTYSETGSTVREISSGSY